MRTVELDELENKLTEYLQLAAGGEILLVVDRGRVVAELKPPRPGQVKPADDGQLTAMFREGLLRPALVPRGTVPPRQPVVTTEQLLGELTADRESR